MIQIKNFTNKTSGSLKIVIQKWIRNNLVIIYYDRFDFVDIQLKY